MNLANTYVKRCSCLVPAYFSVHVNSRARPTSTNVGRYSSYPRSKPQSRSFSRRILRPDVLHDIVCEELDLEYQRERGMQDRDEHDQRSGVFVIRLYEQKGVSRGTNTC